MQDKKLKTNQNKLEIGVAIGFSLLILILSSTKIGYIPITNYRSLDLSLIPALFAAMIGGYRVGIPVAIAWALVGYSNDASNLQVYSLFGLMASKMIYVVSATWSYKLFRKHYVASPYNVYRTVVAAVTIKALASNFILVYMLKSEFIIEHWLRYGIREFILEIMLCTLCMGLLIKHLRQVHILNGVRRKEKMRSGLQSTVHYQQSKPPKNEDL